MPREKNSESLTEWFCGLFATSGSFYITTQGETAAGYPRYVLGATISIYVSRSDMFTDIVELVGGRLPQDEKSYYGRVTWRVHTFAEVSAVVELLDRADCPVPILILKQLDIAKRFLETKMPPGRPKDADLVGEIQWVRAQLHAEMLALMEWKKSLGRKKEKKEA